MLTFPAATFSIVLVASVAFVVDSWAFGTTGASNMVAGRADEKHH